MSNQAQQDFQKINKVLMDVINTALAYLLHHDDCYKKHCLETSAWDGIEKLEEIVDSLSEPLLAPVRICLDECTKARKRMPEININYQEEFPVAAASLTRLAELVEQILEANPSLKNGTDKDKLMGHQMYVNLAEVASQM